MLHLDVRVMDTSYQDVQCIYIMREICGPYDEAIYEKYITNYAIGFSVEELIASCAADGAVSFHQKHGKMSELVSLIIEKED